ncbi:MAG TPA: hypothetical protein IAA88_07185 [Candidatus Avimuribaculum pullicola]|nr:hypothetical protein [Candidatus Avimuribaculum pullicola]
MKKLIFALPLLMAAMLVMPSQAAGREATTGTDSITTAIRLNTLNKQRQDLQDSIKVADAARNASIDGVSPERMEQINDQQDSLCLALRSRLVSVELEIEEITPDRVPSQLLQQYGDMLQNSQQGKKD